MSARVLSQLSALVFVLLGVAAFSTRYYARHTTQVALEDSRWRLTYSLQFDVEGSDATARIGLPTSTGSDAAKVEVEELSHTDLKGEIRESTLTGNRELVVSAIHPGNYRVAAEFDILLSPRRSWDSHHTPEALSTATRSRFIRSEDQFPTQSPGVQRVLQQISATDATDGEYLQRFFDFCSEELDSTTAEEGGDEVALALATRRATPLGRARVLVTLCRAERIPARLVTGFELRQQSNPQPHVWVEAFQGHRWVPFDPTFGYTRQMPYYFVPVRHDGNTVIRGDGIANVTPRYHILRLPPPEDVLKSEMRRPSQIFDLTRLPVEMHEIMSLMLLLPLGALITAIFRNIIGVRTLGTFAPALLAMSFLFAAFGTGLVILVVVLMAGLVGRNLLDRLHLLMVPRSSIVLTLIILCVVFGVSLLDYAYPESPVRAVLLPLVILTILIERFFVTSEEDGIGFAIQLVVGTAVVAACCYLILSWQQIGNLLLIYPELHFFTVALFIWIGRYSGYRLIELWRFRDILNDRRT